MRVKGMPKKTINADGSDKNLVKKEMYQQLAKGIPFKEEFQSIQRNLFNGDVYLAGYTQHRTINPPKNLKEYFGEKE